MTGLVGDMLELCGCIDSSTYVVLDEDLQALLLSPPTEMPIDLVEHISNLYEDFNTICGC